MFQPEGTLTELFDLITNRVMWKLRLEWLEQTVRDYTISDIELTFKCPHSKLLPSNHTFRLDDPLRRNNEIVKKFTDLLRQYYQEKFDEYDQKVEMSRKELIRVAVLAGEHIDQGQEEQRDK